MSNNKNQLTELLELVAKYGDYYYDLASKELKKNNTIGNIICTTQAGAYQRIRYVIEDMLMNETNTNKINL